MAERKTNTGKKLTTVQLNKEAKNARKVKRASVKIGGEDYWYEIDTAPTTSRRADYVQNIRALVAYVSTEEAFDFLNQQQTADFLSAMIVAEIFNVFSTLEVGDTVEEKVEFVGQCTDVGIFAEMVKQIPEELYEVVQEAESSVSKVVDELTAEAKRIEEQIINLENLSQDTVEDGFEETEGE